MSLPSLYLIILGGLFVAIMTARYAVERSKAKKSSNRQVKQKHQRRTTT